MPRRKEPEGITPKVVARLWARVDKAGECWIWTGNADKYGRSTFAVGGKQRRPRHVSYEIAFGPIPPEHEVFATCENRLRCLRPEHLVCRPLPPADIAERFWARVDRRSEDECWEWSGHRDQRGYGRGGTNKAGGYLAHRMAYMLHAGVALPDSTLVCHRCDNPPCCNPAHLFTGTHKDNAVDMAAKGRWKNHLGCGPGHPEAHAGKSP